jgi:hypothetical protein
MKQSGQSGTCTKWPAEKIPETDPHKVAMQVGEERMGVLKNRTIGYPY